MSYAQSVKVSGILKDSDNLVIETANVMAINQVTKAMDAYNITSEKGEFSLNLKANTEYIIKAGYIGYAPFEQKITTTKENQTFNIVLSSSNTIETVEIVREMPVRISGDTIIYNSDSFTNGTEKKLEDVLKKLPGVSVNKDGEISVEGKTAQKLMVNGKDFFDGDTKLGVKNIPADAIDKVQVLRNFNEDKTLENEIAEIQVSESHPLKEHIHYLRLSSLMTFDLKRFDKSINLNKRNDFKIESKFEARPLESFVENIFDGFAFESKNLSAKKENDSFLPVIKIANVVNDIGIKTNFEYHELTKDLEKFIINKNDILLSLTGGESNVAKIALYKEEQKCLLNQRVGAIRIENDVSRKYVYLFLSTYFSRYAQIKSHGTVQKNYSLKLVRDFQIPIPPIEVQEKIVAEILQIEAQEETAKATIQKNEEKIKSLFGKGEKVKLTNIALMIKRGKSPQYGFSSVQIIKSGQVRGMYNFDFSKKYFVNKEFILDDRKLESGDILINSTGVGTAGRVNLFNLQGDFVVDSHITIIRLDKAKVLPKFALYELYSIGFDTIEKMANGQSGQIELSKETIENILINLPSVAEQENIIKQIEPLEKEIEEAKTFLSKSKEQKQEVLNKYLI
jgi:restriction endonuclease S subunit